MLLTLIYRPHVKATANYFGWTLWSGEILTLSDLFSWELPVRISSQLDPLPWEQVDTMQAPSSKPGTKNDVISYGWLWENYTAAPNHSSKNKKHLFTKPLFKKWLQNILWSSLDQENIMH